MTEQKPRVVICGGGFAGRRAERLLRAERRLDVTLVDAGGCFEYVPAALRALVHPKHACASVLPQPSGTRCAAVTGLELSRGEPEPAVSAVLLSDGGRLPCDYVLFATGSAYAAPIKAPAGEPGTVHARRAHYRNACTRLEAAASALVVGGGTVGVELAAEIAAKWGKTKRVTLVASQPTLLERMPPQAGRFAADWLHRAGVDLVFGERVTDWGGADTAGWGTPGAWRVRTSAGRSLHAAAVFNCVGARPAAAYLRAVPGALDARGAIDTLPTLRLRSLRNAYAAGDVAAHGAEATALTADLTASVAAHNIVAASCGGARTLTFPEGACAGSRVVPDIAAVSLGPYNGVMVFNQLVVRGPPVAALKWTIEQLQCATARGYTLPGALWGAIEATNVYLGTKLFRGRPKAMA